MGIFNLFSKRQKIKRGEIPDVYRYDRIPRELRTQLIYIIQEAVGKRTYAGYENDVLVETHDILAKEIGKFEIHPRGREAQGEYSKIDALFHFILDEVNVERVLDVIEVFFSVLRKHSSDFNYKYRNGVKSSFGEAVNELNIRFKEHAIGFEYQNNQLIKIEDEFMHSQAIKPALIFLNEPGFDGARIEFLNAHEHFRLGRYEECITECLKSFESTLKIICTKMGWTFDEKDTASKLIEKAFQNGLVPSYLQTQFSSMRSQLESGIPTVRNRNSGHGRGNQNRNVPQHLAAYQINLTASAITYLVESMKKIT